ncbi:SHOCT domain-containing protein [Mesobacterium pallidum]|uniref:SHOCT domain-containing protein n=1 Tax=Mesobacterium pallidum TaxID=2872037 RepID=UPI001EE219CD|nr:SHOCT domain-containing protein [Mesobacterium pallidum]
MTRLTPDGTARLSDIAARNGVTTDAAETLFFALLRGGGTQAQFSHPDLGGMGQWSQGGMTMVGDMFNNGLKARVDALCSEIAPLVRDPDVLVPEAMPGAGVSFAASGGGSRWPEELGVPSSSGSQNDLRYAVFPGTRRLAIDQGGRIEVFDTGDHAISGVSQQQVGDRTLTFTSQFGLVRVSDLPRVEIGAAPVAETPVVSEAPFAPAPSSQVWAPEPQTAPVPTPEPAPTGAVEAPKQPSSDGEAIIGLIRKLAELRDAGILTEAEFETKKAELLARL